MNSLNNFLSALPMKNEAWGSVLGFVLLGILTKINANVPVAWHFDDTWIQGLTALITFYLVNKLASIRQTNTQTKGTENAGA